MRTCEVMERSSPNWMVLLVLAAWSIVLLLQLGFAHADGVAPTYALARYVSKKYIDIVIALIETGTLRASLAGIVHTGCAELHSQPGMCNACV